MSQALKRIECGPRNWIDPKEEFVNQDKIQYCESKCKAHESKSGEKCYVCNICTKKFKSLDFAVKHIQTKHQDIIDETY